MMQWNNHSVRVLELASIRAFVTKYRGLLTGRVLDFGAGKPGTCAQPQPYRGLVSGEYVPIDVDDYLPAGPFHAALCTQVLQYCVDPRATLDELACRLAPGAHLVMTYPTNWDEVETSDLWRFTKAGMERLLGEVGLTVVEHERRAEINLNGFKFPLGYGAVARKPRLTDTPNQDASAAILTGKLVRREPFLYIRYGDGAIECINEIGGTHTCDGEFYSPGLGADLKASWDAVIGVPNVFVGDWLSASFDGKRSGEYAEQYAQLLGNHKPAMLHFEALLLMRESKALVDFYRAVKADTRRKVLLGPERQAAAAKLLGCEHIVTPMKNLYQVIPEIERLLYVTGFDLLLYGAGMAGNIPVVNLWKKHPERTYIHLGSALDPLCGVKSRRQQISPEQVRRMLHELR